MSGKRDVEAGRVRARSAPTASTAKTISEGDQQRRQVRAGRQRRRAEPLQDPGLAPDHEHDREPGERGRDRRRSRASRPARKSRAADAVDRVVPVDRAEQDEEEHREQEGEEGELAAAPVRAAARPCSSWRKSLTPRAPPRSARGRPPRALGRRTSRPSSSRRSASAACGQLVQHARRLVRLEHDLAAVLAVADLGRRARRRSAPRACPRRRSGRRGGRRRGRRAARPRRGSASSAGSSCRAPRSERIVSHAARRAAGSKPVVGSSRKISSGSPTSARPRSSRRCWPPERRPHAGVALLRRGRRARSPRRRRAAARSSRRRARSISATVRFGYSADDWRTTPIRSRQSLRARRRVGAEHRRPRRRRACGSPRGSRPSSSCRRRSGPSRPKTSPRSTSKSIPRTASSAPYDLRRSRTAIAVTQLEREHARRAGRPAPRRR